MFQMLNSQMKLASAVWDGTGLDFPEQQLTNNHRELTCDQGRIHYFAFVIAGNLYNNTGIPAFSLVSCNVFTIQ